MTTEVNTEGEATTVEAEGEEVELAGDNLIDLLQRLTIDNAQCINRLKLIGQVPTPNLRLDISIAVLIDMLFEEGSDQRRAYDCGCAIRLNQALRGALENHAAQLIAP